MLKIVVFDCGYGGEFFADELAAALPVVEIIRVINWREADKLSASPYEARKILLKSLRPYIGTVDLIIIANYYLSITSLNYLKRRFKKQQFLGLQLKSPDTFIKRDTLILSTKPVSTTFTYQFFVHQIKRNVKTLNVDSWPILIDDGELTQTDIKQSLDQFLIKHPGFCPKELILASSQFNDIKEDLKTILGQSLRIYDGFSDTIRKTSQILRLRGGAGKRR